MDILRKELSAIYHAQNLDTAILSGAVVDNIVETMRHAVAFDNNCRVVTDAAADSCCIIAGSFASVMGLQQSSEILCKSFSSSDEDLIYARMHPEDLADKRMLEYEFFRHIDSLPAPSRLKYKATCRIRMRNRSGDYIHVDNSTQILRLAPHGGFWLILCTYAISPVQEATHGIEPRIMDMSTGDSLRVQLNARRANILSAREKQILALIGQGKASKQIADSLALSIHTINRHRQNILQKLSVSNSTEAVIAANAMKLL